MGTKIRPYFKNRQAFPVQIVFGFCLGVRSVPESHKLVCVSRLTHNNSAASHDGFGKKCEKSHHRKDLPTLPHLCGPGGRAWALAKKKGAAGENLPRRPRRSSGRELPAVCPQNDGFLDLDVGVGRIYKLLEIDGRGPVGITLAPLEKGESLLKHRQRPIGGVERLRYRL